MRTQPWSACTVQLPTRINKADEIYAKFEETQLEIEALKRENQERQ